jgi:hypothetical protein
MTRWQCEPAVLADERVILLDRATRLRRSTPRGSRKMELGELARAHGVSERTLYRYLNDFHPCPGFPEGSCLTKVRGGGLCHFCRRTKAMT